VHGRDKTRCSVCNPQSKQLCRHGCGTRLSKGRKEDGICATCTGHITNNERKEYKFLAKLESWGFFPSLHDKTIKDDNCKPPLNRRRPDYLYVTGDDLKYNILVESGNGVNVYTLIGYTESRKQAYIERKLLIKV
jgi:hypothetical protein